MQPDTTLPKTPAVKIYRALLTQDGGTTNPTAIVMENTTGTTITWLRDSTGQYYATNTGLYKENKTWATISLGSGYLDTLNANISLYIYTGTGDENHIFITSEFNGQLDDGNMTMAAVEIRIYQ